MPKVETSGFLGFTLIIRDVFIAGVFATGIWVLGDQFQKLGYERAANICDFSACIIFLCVLPFEIVKHNSRYWLIITGVFLAAVVAPVWFVFFDLKPVPQPIPYSHFEFRLLRQPGSWDGSIELTNDFFEIHPGPVLIGNLLFPVTDSDVTLRFSVQNLGPPTSRNTRITIDIPATLSPDPTGWEYANTGQFCTLTYHPPDLLNGDSWELPAIHLRKLPILKAPPFPNSYCFIMTRADLTPAELVGFDMVFFQVVTNTVSMPFIAPPLKTDKGITFVVPPELIEMLKK